MAGCAISTLTLPAPAKLNLCLHVTARRADGYHELETVFQLLDFGDEVTLTATATAGVRRTNDVAGVPEEADLSVRAARLLAQHCGYQGGARIHLTKRLPMGGGLGGGSSDAASVLVGLNELWQLDLSVDELAGLGLQLGADLPVFIRGHSAFARGVGEELRSVNLPEQWFLVLWPPIHVETAAIFRSTSLTRDTPHLKIGGFPWNLNSNCGLDDFWARTRNDCEPVVRGLESKVAATIDWLATRGPARMSGTGACAFARFRSRVEADRAFEELRLLASISNNKAGGNKSGSNRAGSNRAGPAGKLAEGAAWPQEWVQEVCGFVARGVNRSPLATAIEKLRS